MRCAAVVPLLVHAAMASHSQWFTHSSWQLDERGRFAIVPSTGTVYVQVDGSWTPEQEAFPDPPPVYVGTADELQAAVANETVHHIKLQDVWFNFTKDGVAPPTQIENSYNCTTTALCITRRMIIESASAGTPGGCGDGGACPVLNAQGSSSTPRRVMLIDPSNYLDHGTQLWNSPVQIKDVHITGGYGAYTYGWNNQNYNGGGVFANSGYMLFERVEIYGILNDSPNSHFGPRVLTVAPSVDR